MKTPVCGNECVHVGESSAWSVISEIVASGLQDDAFFVCDLGDIVRKYREWKNVMPRVVPHYAVKCNDTPLMLEVLAALGSGFDCASKGEINKILALGVHPSKIVLANTCKTANDIRYAGAVGVDWMTFDNEIELHKIQCLYPNAKLVLRIRSDDTSARNALGPKFGSDPITEAPRLLELAHVLGLDVVGISFHVGSDCGNPLAFRKAIAAARNLFDFGATLGYNFNLLDIGGGFPGDKGTSLDKIAMVVNEALDDLFPDPSVHVIAEPGRFMAACALTLATNIHSKKTLVSAAGVHHMYYINDGIYNGLNSILHDHSVPVPQPLKKTCGKMEKSTIWGPTCDSKDKVRENILMPELNIGDWVIFENTGAYNLPMLSSFNGFSVTKVHTIASPAVWELLKPSAFLLHECDCKPYMKYTDTVTPSFRCCQCSDDEKDICSQKQSTKDHVFMGKGMLTNGSAAFLQTVVKC